MIRSQRLAVAVLPAVFVIGATLLHAGVTPPAGAAAASPSSPAAETAPPPAEAPAPAPPPGWSEKDKDPSRIERGSVPLEVTVGAGLVLTTPSELERVALADDTLARVTVLSKREVMLNGLAAGRTTLFLWLTDTRRLRYVVVVRRDLGLIERVVKELDDRIDVEASPDGNSVILRGDVENQATAEAAVGRAEETLRMLAADPSQKDATKVKVLNLLRYTPVVKANADDRLQQALAAIDGRIRVRRIQVGTEAEAGKDAVILEGKVRSISALMRAITLAERQLGGSGSKILAADERRRSRDRSGSFSGISGAGATGSTALNGNEPPPPGIAAQIARGLVLTSESGRVVSFLSVDRIQQIQVAIRVLEIDRSRARTLGVDYRIDGRHFSISGLNGCAGADVAAAGVGFLHVFLGRLVGAR